MTLDLDNEGYSAKQYLKQVELLDIKLAQKRRELDQLRQDYGLAGIDYSKDHVQGNSKTEASFVRMAERASELEREISDAIVKLINCRETIINEIHSLQDERYIKLLYMRYVDYASLCQIARQMSYAYHYTAKLHWQALRAFEKEFILRK